MAVQLNNICLVFLGEGGQLLKGGFSIEVVAVEKRDIFSACELNADVAE